jgi:signal transduction histidine kinase
MARVLRLGIGAAGLGVGAFSLALARSEPGYSFAGSSAYASAAELLAGYALLAVGLIASTRPRQARLGTVLVAASITWFLLEWNNPGAGSAFVFTVGLVLYLAAAPLIAHAVLAYPDGRLRSRLDRVGLALAYGGTVVVLGLLAASVFDPAAQRCAQCPRNLLLVYADGGIYGSINRVGIRLGVVWGLLLIVLVVANLVRSTPARRRVAAPVTLVGCLYLGFVAADFVHGAGRGFLSNDSLDRRLWLGEAAALCSLALAVAWGWVRARRTRSELAALVLELSESSPGGLRDMLAVTLDDPALELAYPLDDGRLVDARGRPARLEREVTPVVRAGREVACLSHRPGLFDDPTLAEEVAATARLALENERLQAQTRAQLEELRASRARIVEAGDAERRRLERDLHDGAQQRLVGLLLSLRLARSHLGPDSDPALLAPIEEAEAELRAAVAELRELAHGIFPAALDEEGFSAAVEALAEGAAVPVEMTALPQERLAPAVEAAAYFVVAEAMRQSDGTPLLVSAARHEGRLVVEVESERGPAEIVALEDRVGALDGTVEVVHEPGVGVRIRAEIPCGS